MKKSSMTLAAPVLIGVASWSLPALAQNQVLRTCRAEWRANQAGLRANGITQEVYVADCQTTATKGTAATVPAATDPAGKAASKAEKTIQACRREWQLSKTALRANGITQKVFVSDCQAAAAKVSPSAAAPAAAEPPAKPAAATISPAPDAASEKIRACQEEWRIKRTVDEIPVTEKAYVEQCRSGGNPSQSSAPR